MIKRTIRELPIEPMSFIGLEEARRIIAIPDEAIEYTKEEAEWMVRALGNLDYMIEIALSSDGNTAELYRRREQIQFALDSYNLQNKSG